MRMKVRNKRGASRRFNKSVARTKKLNLRAVPMRGGFRI